MTETTPPPDSESPAGEPGRTDALRWAREQLSADGIRRLLRGIARLLRWMRPFGLAIALLGFLGLAAGGALFRTERDIAIIVILLSLPALIAPLRTRQRLGQLATALDDPDGMITQARDLARDLRASPQLRALFEREHRRRGTETRRLGRTIRTLRSVSAVVGAAR